MVASAIPAPASCSSVFRNRAIINSRKSIVSALTTPSAHSSSTNGLSIKPNPFRLTLDKKDSHGAANLSYGPVVANMGGYEIPPWDLSPILFRNRIIFIGQPIFGEVAQQVISELVTLATVDENSDILLYLNCPGGSIYSVLAIYDCMSWIKPKVGTVCFGFTSNQAALLLAGGEKGMRYAMPNARIMIHQPLTECGGRMETVRRQVKEAIHSRDKIDQMLATFTGQPLDTVQRYTERERYMSAAEAMEFGLIDGLLETEI